MKDVMEKLRLRFTSGNDVPVTRAHITLDEYETLRTKVAELEAGSEPVAHMYPSDLKRFETSETFATAYSVEVGKPSEESVPLYTTPQPVKVPEGFISVPVELIHEYMELLGGAKYKAIHSMVRINACKAMLAAREGDQ